MFTASDEKSTEEAEIRSLIEDLTRKLRAKDASGLMAHYTADRVQFLLAPPLQFSGANAIKAKDLKDWFSSFEGPIEYEVHDLRIATSNQIAFCHALSRLSGSRVGGKKTDLWLRWTVCFRKVEGAWKIAHEHESVPFYMDGSERAALDLKP
jgi:PhnB protein